MKSHWLRNTLIIIVLGVVILVLAILLGAFRSSSVDEIAYEPLTEEERVALIPRGRELALAGDCIGCHSQTQGPKAGGGVDMPTPFGTIYSTNITPDTEYGIGDYSRADFHRVMRDGIAPGGRNLYPAMPYVFTHVATSEDIDAIYAYIMSLEPLAVPNKSNTGVFTLPVRPFVNFWTLFNFPDRSKVVERSDRSEQWVQGAYLVEGLAHCAACHTPRNFMMGMDFSRNLEGGEVKGIDAPDITAQALADHGFDLPSLTEYLQVGVAAQGTAFSEMYRITHFSTSQMDPSAVKSMAVYLLTDENGKLIEPKKTEPFVATSSTAETESYLDLGKNLYSESCAGCHGVNGEGIPNVAPAMQGNSTIAMDDPHNTIYVTLTGLPTQSFAGNQRMYAMPGFADRFNKEELAQLLTWVRAKWGEQTDPVTIEQVEKTIESQNKKSQ